MSPYLGSTFITAVVKQEVKRSSEEKQCRKDTGQTHIHKSDG